jgi:hypothetical protein
MLRFRDRIDLCALSAFTAWLSANAGQGVGETGPRASLASALLLVSESLLCVSLANQMSHH